MGLHPSRMKSSTEESGSSSDESDTSSSLSLSSTLSGSGVSPPHPPPSPTHSSSGSSSLHFGGGGEDSDGNSSTRNISIGSSSSEEDSPSESLRNYSTSRPHLTARRRISRQISSESDAESDDEEVSRMAPTLTGATAARSSARIRRLPGRLSTSIRPVVVPAVPPPASTTSTRGRVGRPRGTTRRVVTARVVTPPLPVVRSGTAAASAATRAPPPATASTSTSASGPSVANPPATGSGRGKSKNIVQPPSPARANTSFNPSYFECVVCLENLDSPATLIESAPAVDDPLGPGGMRPVIAILNRGVGLVQLPAFQLPLFQGQVQQPQVPAVPRITAASLAIARKENALAKIDPREICTTACGHLYHKYCIQKWFNEQGRKTCPSCRKPCGAKLIRLFPNIGQDVPSRRENHPQPNLGGTVGDGSSDGGAALVAPSGAAVDSGPGGPERRPIRTGCGNPECADLATIHETLCSDYNEMRTAFRNVEDQLRGAQEDLHIRTAEMASVQDMNTNLQREVADLKSVAETSKSGVNIKRRRRSRND